MLTIFAKNSDVWYNLKYVSAFSDEILKFHFILTYYARKNCSKLCIFFNIEAHSLSINNYTKENRTSKNCPLPRKIVNEVNCTPCSQPTIFFQFTLKLTKTHTHRKNLRVYIKPLRWPIYSPLMQHFCSVVKSKPY